MAGRTGSEPFVALHPGETGAFGFRYSENSRCLSSLPDGADAGLSSAFLPAVRRRSARKVTVRHVLESRGFIRVILRLWQSARIYLVNTRSLYSESSAMKFIPRFSCLPRAFSLIGPLVAGRVAAQVGGAMRLFSRFAVSLFLPNGFFGLPEGHHAGCRCSAGEVPS